MAHGSRRFEVHVQIGAKRTFAAALDWPGWTRSGRDEAAALQALADYGARYGRAIASAQLEFRAPQGSAGFSVVERLKGTTTTDFGAPDASPASDQDPLGAAGLVRAQALLKACWRAFDSATRVSGGTHARDRSPPRWAGFRYDRAPHPGGRGRLSRAPGLFGQTRRTRRTAIGTAPPAGRGARRAGRGGLRWRPRYFVRRVAWHLLDHAWEIEDRSH